MSEGLIYKFFIKIYLIRLILVKQEQNQIHKFSLQF